MSYYYKAQVPAEQQQDGTLGPITDQAPGGGSGTQVGKVTNEQVSNSNVLSYQFFNTNSSGQTVTDGQIIRFSFELIYGNLTSNPGVEPAPINGANVDIYQSNGIALGLFGIEVYGDKVANFSIPNFREHDNPNLGYSGYGGFSVDISSTQVSIGGDTGTINWYGGNELLPNTTYYIKVGPSLEYSRSSSTTYAVFTTLDTAPIIPAVVNPNVTNGFITYNQWLPVTTTQTTANLINDFYYQYTPQTTEEPSEVGFQYRKLGDTLWSTAEIVTFTGTIPVGSVNKIVTTLEITGLDSFTDYEYVSYIKDNNNNIYYSTISGLVTDITNAHKRSFKTTPAFVTGWENPDEQNGVSWYQIYNDWELVDPLTPNSNNKVTPYFRVKEHTSLDLDKTFSLFYFINKTFKKDKNYQFRTLVENFYSYLGNTTDTSSEKSELTIRTPWGEKFEIYKNLPYLPISNVPDTMKVLNLYLYSNINSFDSDPTTSGISKPKPIEEVVSKNNPQNPVSFIANSYFNGTVNSPINTSNSLLDLNISDLNWNIQGFASFNIMDYSGTGPISSVDINTLDQIIPAFDTVTGEAIGGKGWHFIENKGEFVWFDKYNNTDLYENVANLPIGGDVNEYYYGKTSERKYLTNNFISRYISYQTFNINFDYLNESDYKISLYLGGDLPTFDTSYNLTDLLNDGSITKLTTFGKSNDGDGSTQSCEFVGIEGNQYLFFVADPVYNHIDGENELTTTVTYNSTINQSPLTSTTYSVISLSNFKISGAYNELNNLNFNILATSSYVTENVITNATYSVKLGTGNNVIPGVVNNIIEVNSLAGNGRFNSGIWENGVWNNGWREDLTRGELYKIDQFYSSNRDKKWRIKISGPTSTINTFTIGDKVSISNIVAIDINEERKLLKKYYTIIDIVDNYIEVEFENDFPLRRIEIDSDEHRIHISKNVWLSGVFLNGYFKGIWNSGLFSGFPMITKMDDSHWIDGTFNGGHFTANKYGTTFSTVFAVDLSGVTRLGLSFYSPHKLTKDDIISINPNQYLIGQDVKNNSLGTTVVTEVIDDNTLVTGISWETDFSHIGNGDIYSIISSGLIQNFDFYSNNVSTVTSLKSLLSERVFSYNSWIDVNYSNQSAVNIGRPQSILEPDTNRSYSENNLYGYPTNDVLTSNSVFRDSFSTSFRKYKLGKKWKVFNDYIGDSSSFEEYFDSTDTTVGLQAFNDQGWDMSINSNQEFKLTTNSILVDTSGGDTDKLTMEFNGDVTSILFPTKITNTTGYYDNDTNYYSTGSVDSSSYNTSTNITTVEITNDILVHDGSITLDATRTTYITISLVNGLTFSRATEPSNGNSPLIGKELKVSTLNRGGFLNLTTSYDILNRANGTDTQTLEKNRYSLIEFDIVDHLGTSSYIDGDTGNSQPSIHFNNLNYVTRTINSVEKSISASYLPISKNVNHLMTRNKTKQEFFFNKRNLLMNLKGTGINGLTQTEYYLDNIKLYEVDMIPFFQYFISPINTQGNINKSVQIPTSGTSPVIEFTDDDIIDTSDTNDIITFFSNNLIASNVEIPDGINWERDYSIYRTQITGNDILGSSDIY